MSKLLGDTVRVFTTKCVMKELRGLGAEYTATRQACKRYALHSCGHDDSSPSAADCLISQIENANSEHFFVATQDRGLQRRAKNLPGGAVIFASVNGVHLDSPSDAQRQHEMKQEEAQQLPGQVERRSKQFNDLLEEDDEPQAKPHAPSGIFRRNRAKGPNPLSIKKKRRTSEAGPSVTVTAAAGGASPGGGSHAGHKRKRLRRKRADDHPQE